MALAEIGKYEDAIEKVSEITNYVPAIWRSGYWNLDLGKFKESEELFQRAITRKPNCVAAIIGLARVKLANNSPQEAITLLDNIISRGGSHPYITFLLGTAHRRAGNSERATQLLSAPLSGPPRWEDQWFDEMQSHTKGYAADLGRALQKFDGGDMTGAIKSLKTLAIRYPKDPAILNNLGTVYLQLGQIEQAKETLTKSMRWSPNYAPTQLTMALVLQKTGQIDLAIAYAKKAIEYQPAMSAAHALLGRVYFQKRDFPSASKYFRQSIELGNSDPSNREMLGMVLLNVGKPTDALQQFQLVLQTSPNRTVSISGKCIATALLGDSQSALQTLAEAKTQFPNDPQIERAWQAVLKIKERQ